MAKLNKARFWTGVLYQENMLSDWRDKLPDIVQVPFAYCEHTKDVDAKSEHRKDHVHLILAMPNTTTYNHVLGIMNLLSAEGCKAVNKVEAVISIRHCYDYLIHDTETCRKQKKHLYDASDRITGNNFDIGAFEQLGVKERNDILQELCALIIREGITNFADFYSLVMTEYDDSSYFEVIKGYSGLLERLTKGNYQRSQNVQR